MHHDIERNTPIHNEQLSKRYMVAGKDGPQIAAVVSKLAELEALAPIFNYDRPKLEARSLAAEITKCGAAGDVDGMEIAMEQLVRAPIASPEMAKRASTCKAAHKAAKESLVRSLDPIIEAISLAAADKADKDADAIKPDSLGQVSPSIAILREYAAQRRLNPLDVDLISNRRSPGSAGEALKV